MSTEESTETSELSGDSEPNLHLDISDVTCPICKDVFVFPRTYECGHNGCETCMYEMDRRDESGDTHTAKIHRCPVCRHPTLKSWHTRPISVLLERIATNHPDYKRRREEVMEMNNKRLSGIIYIPDNIDIAAASYESRIKLALDLYDTILERVYIAAKQGKNHIIIKELSIVSQIEKVGDILSLQLFSKHNIYRLIVTRGECTIYLTRNAFTWRRNFENTEWLDPSDRETPPPPPPPHPSPPSDEEMEDSLSALLPRGRLRRNSILPPGTFSSRRR